MGSGPASMIMTGVMQYRNFIGFCINRNDFRLACLFVRTMAAIMPVEAKIKIPDIPHRHPSETNDLYRAKLIDWIDENLVVIEQGIANYVKRFYERGNKLY